MAKEWDLVIFDCDEVLVDSEPISNGTMVEMLGEIGLAMTLAESMDLLRGRSILAVISLVEERLGHQVPANFLDQYYLRIDQAFQRELKPVPGVIDALDRITLPACVASSGPHRKIKTTLGVTGLLSRFEGRIYSAVDVGRGKPSPDLFLHAARSMETEPGRCVVIEDAVPGIQAAIAAGMHVFGYAGDSSPDALREAGAEVFMNMADLPGLLGM